MQNYIVKRLLFIIPTLVLILGLNFLIIQLAPGGPIEQAMQRIALFQNQYGVDYQVNQSLPKNSAISQGIPVETLDKLKQYYGFDQSLSQRFYMMLKNYFSFNFGESFFLGKSVKELILQRLPISFALGFLSLIFIYSIAIPLGIYKAKYHQTKRDRFSSLLLAMLYAIPSFVIALLLLILFASGQHWQWFPLQGMMSESFSELTLLGKAKDILWHLVLPVFAIVLTSFASLTYLTKYAFLQEFSKLYVKVALAKGLTEQQVLYKHIFRNAILLIIATLPETLLALLFAGNVFVEIVFNIQGLGLLGFEAIVQRDYPVIFATLYIYTLLGLALKLCGDILYHLIDPRIDFDVRA
ncbi:ABC transporter permease subunit [Acinetobacter sp. c3-l95]|uniref:ABC transporter permease subunit n=1 Tax=Acinetobacter sp. c3-l95 TaxID=3342804 RepID=UPI0035BB3C93